MAKLYFLPFFSVIFEIFSKICKKILEMENPSKILYFKDEFSKLAALAGPFLTPEQNTLEGKICEFSYLNPFF